MTLSKPCLHCPVTQAQLDMAVHLGKDPLDYHHGKCRARASQGIQSIQEEQPVDTPCNCEQSQALQVQLDRALERGRLVLDHHHQMAQRHVEQIVVLETECDEARKRAAPHEREALRLRTELAAAMVLALHLKDELSQRTQSADMLLEALNGIERQRDDAHVENDRLREGHECLTRQRDRVHTRVLGLCDELRHAYEGTDIREKMRASGLKPAGLSQFFWAIESHRP